MTSANDQVNAMQLEQLLAKRKITPRIKPLITMGNEGLATFYTRAEKMGVGRQCLSCGRVRRFSKLKCVCGELQHIQAKVNSIEKTFDEEVEVFLQQEEELQNPMAHGNKPPADLYEFRRYNEQGELVDETDEPTASTKTQVPGVTLEEVVQVVDPKNAALSVIIQADLKALRSLARKHKLTYKQTEDETSLRARLTEKLLKGLAPVESPAPTEDGSTLTEEEIDELTTSSAEKQALGE